MNLTQPVTKGLNDAQTSAPDPFLSVLYKIITTYEESMKDLIFYFCSKHSVLKMAPFRASFHQLIFGVACPR